jgi:hypothetical protein
MYDSHFGLEAVILGSGEDEGQTKYPSTVIGTTTGRHSEDNRGFGHCAGKYQTCNI